MFIPISPSGLLRLFPCSLLVLFLSFHHSFRVVRALFFSCGCRFYRFPVSVFSLTPFVSRRFRSHRVPLSPVSSVSRSFPLLTSFVCRLPVGGALSLSACSRPVALVSLFRAVGRGGGACSVVWGIVPWRGVAWMAGCFVAFCLAARFLRCAGRGVLGGFFMWKLSGGLFVGRGGFVASGGKRTPQGISCSLGAFFLVWIVLYVGCYRSISSCVARWCGWRWRRRRGGRLRLLLALRRFGRVAEYRPGRELGC